VPVNDSDPLAKIAFKALELGLQCQKQKKEGFEGCVTGHFTI
jgi:hypothetical protein